MASIKDGKGTLCISAYDTSAELKKAELGRPVVGPNDVAIDIKFCGMCHSDVHACNGDWFLNVYPLTPGHEIAGVATEVGANVTGIKVGDRVGVGCMVESCNNCDLCAKGLENYCPNMIQTYSSAFPEGKGDNFKECAGFHTNGGYSEKIVVNNKFVFHVPEKMSLDVVGPLLCAGITTFSPFNRHILQKGGGAGMEVGIVGFGGLGHMAVKIAVAMGAKVTVLSRTTKKAAEAKSLGADIIGYTELDDDARNALGRKFNLVIDTVSAPHPIAPMVSFLNVGATYVLLGGIPQPFEVSSMPLLFNNIKIEGSLIGGIPETQLMLDFCAEHDIKPEIKVIAAKDANTQFRALMDGTADAARAVIDISTIKEM